MYIVRNSLILHKSIFMLIVLKIIVFNFLSFVAGTHQHYAASSQPAFKMRYECMNGYWKFGDCKTSCQKKPWFKAVYFSFSIAWHSTIGWHLQVIIDVIFIKTIFFSNLLAIIRCWILRREIVDNSSLVISSEISFLGCFFHWKTTHLLKPF